MMVGAVSSRVQGFGEKGGEEEGAGSVSTAYPAVNLGTALIIAPTKVLCLCMHACMSVLTCVCSVT